jgi:hypothetical protein
MKIVKIFKTDVEHQVVARYIIFFLQQTFSNYRINFDLEDTDNILRIESQQGSIDEREIQSLLASCGHQCEPLA